jgi:nucleotide-binding universal stress UspA family protein
VPDTEERRYARSVVDEAVSALERDGFSAVGQVIEGYPGHEIVRSIELGDYDLTLVGAGSKGWAGRVLLGSVSTRVLHASPTSVLVVHQPPMAGIGASVLVGVDGSPDSDLGMEILAKFADPRRCRCTVLSVAASQVPVLIPPGFAYATGGYSEEVELELTQLAREHAQEGTKRLQAAGLRAEPRVVMGSPATRLLTEAERIRADLIAVGTRGQGPVDRALLGSVSDTVARHARATLVARRIGPWIAMSS